MARVFDIALKAAKKNRFDLFGFFAEDHVMNAAEQEEAKKAIAEKFPQYKILSTRLDGARFIVRVQEGA